MQISEMRAEQKSVLFNNLRIEAPAQMFTFE
jgi:hypothetical protein